jgi:hypothetical protein
MQSNGEQRNRALLAKSGHASHQQRGNSERKEYPAKKPVDIAKKPIDSESYKLYYVNYEICRNPKSTACQHFSG